MDDIKVRYGYKAQESADSILADFLLTISFGILIGFVSSLFMGGVVLMLTS